MEKIHFPETIFTIHQVLILVSILVKDLSLKSMSFLQDFVGFCTCMSVLHHDDDDEDQKQQQQQQLQEPPVQNAASVEGLRRGDLELILSRMGLGPSEEDEEEDLYELLPNLFAEEEPSLEELRQAFFVFDKNDDGFIDAGELRRVLSELGVRDQRLDLDACERMIRVHDRNRDGVMDFGEFLRFMEIGFC
ncbi:hypothetical protein ZIOFF_065031 [Zingiber officinale]|uniref:EF-hand domain-containing protein n=1 Tax=Zingiber officinale TaxID=94328 RepID=A0A8J5KGU2_ZINOF|nr:hypothetical protein ZIOFF_065031 [Zingiber officinale]